MGIVIEIRAYGGQWSRVYFVQTTNEEEAKNKAFQMFRNMMSCPLPKTLEEAIDSAPNTAFSIDVMATVEQIIL